MRTVGIIQARMGSRRLPGKSMRLLAGKPIVELVVERVRRAETLDEVVLAIPDGSADDVLARVGQRLGVRVHRGPEEDVLTRFIGAAGAAGAECVVRVCADRPLIAPEETDRLVRSHLAGTADYSFNHIPYNSEYPVGLGAEALGYATLKRMAEATAEHRHREHVTMYIWEHPESFTMNAVAAPPEIAGADVKLDVDTEQDLERLIKLAALLEGDPSRWTALEIVTAYRRLFPRPLDTLPRSTSPPKGSRAAGG